MTPAKLTCKMKKLLLLLVTLPLLGVTPTPTPSSLFTLSSSLTLQVEYHSIVIYDDQNQAWITIDGQHPNVKTAWGFMQDAFPVNKTTITVTREPIVTRTKDGWVISFKPVK